MRRLAVWLGVPLFAVSVFVGEARAGELESKERRVSATEKSVVDGRDRGLLHPGDPLRVVGREQEGNDLRSRTSALARATRTTAPVDDEENYRRTLALYESRATFDAPLKRGPVESDDATSSVTAETSTASSAEGKSPEGESSSSRTWIGVTSIVVLLATFFWFRQRAV